MKHKWHDEIVAWAGGCEIESMSKDIGFTTDYPMWHANDYQFRIKPQPKEKKYLYVYFVYGRELLFRQSIVTSGHDFAQYIGKIEVEND